MKSRNSSFISKFSMSSRELPSAVDLKTKLLLISSVLSLSLLTIKLCIKRYYAR